ncbi:hypothetical protein FALCPG4_010522 [Fusarium falciforme]
MECPVSTSTPQEPAVVNQGREPQPNLRAPDFVCVLLLGSGDCRSTRDEPQSRQVGFRTHQQHASAQSPSPTLRTVPKSICANELSRLVVCAHRSGDR